MDEIEIIGRKNGRKVYSKIYELADFNDEYHRAEQITEDILIEDKVIEGVLDEESNY